MKIITMNVGLIGTNCYIAYCEDTLEAVVIDPGGDAAKIIKEINKAKLKVKYIINTHGHWDHIADNLEIKQATGAQIMIHNADAGMLDDAQSNLSVFWCPAKVGGPADKLLSDGEIITVGNLKFEVIHTPGHTLGGITLKVEDTVFGGDTLFHQSVGRTDLPGGSEKQILESIKNKLYILNDNTDILPGHGPSTTIGWERKMNPFIKALKVGDSFPS